MVFQRGPWCRWEANGKRVYILGPMILLTNLEKKSTLEELNGVESSYGRWPAVPVIGTPWVSKSGLSCQELGCLHLTPVCSRQTWWASFISTIHSGPGLVFCIQFLILSEKVPPPRLKSRKNSWCAEEEPCQQRKWKQLTIMRPK